MKHLAVLLLLVLSCRGPDSIALSVMHHQLNSSYAEESETLHSWGRSAPYQSYGVTATWDLGKEKPRLFGPVLDPLLGPLPPFEIEERGFSDKAFSFLDTLTDVGLAIVMASLCVLAFVFRDRIRKRLGANHA